MFVATIELWDANARHKRTQLFQVVIETYGSTAKSPDGSNAYRVYLFGPDWHVPTQGPNKGQIAEEKALGEVVIRHKRFANTELELYFVALRELRQEFPQFFEKPDEGEAMSPEMLRAWHGSRMRQIMS